MEKKNKAFVIGVLVGVGMSVLMGSVLTVVIEAINITSGKGHSWGGILSLISSSVLLGLIASGIYKVATESEDSQGLR